MYKNIKLPAPELSELKEVNVDLDMTGRHYAWIATATNQVPEDIALMILQDLMQEDANKLTMPELRYVFTLVKIASLENDYTVTVKCQNIKNKKKCGCENKYDLHLSDADLHATPPGYEVPEITFKTDDKTEETFLVKPPLMDMESALYNWFLTEKGKTMDDIATDLKVGMDFSFLRAAMHLVRPDGTRLIYQQNQFGESLKLLDYNKYLVVLKLYDLCAEVDSFGVQNPDYTFKCKECGGNIDVTLPFFFGLAD